MDGEPRVIWRVNRHPRFTVLEMGEYMALDDGPRETRVRNMKYERIAQTLQYRDLYHAVTNYLVSPVRDGGILAQCRVDLERARDAAVHPQQRDNISYELRALESFERSLNALQIGGFNIERAPIRGRPIMIQRVTINVRPTAHVRITRARGALLFGAIVIDVAKGVEAKTPEAQTRLTSGMVHGAMLLHQYVTEAFAGQDGKPSPDHCIIFNSYRQERVSAPANYRKMLRNVQAVCRNISRGWDNIPPPLDFDPKRAIYRN